MIYRLLLGYSPKGAPNYSNEKLDLDEYMRRSKRRPKDVAACVAAVQKILGYLDGSEDDVALKKAADSISFLNTSAAS